ncbi:MAG: hypothetical protein U0R51_04030 [Solirubrobacterales bacterium]
MNKIQSFGRDLVQDLRDRNLLIPVIALLVAIVAVPILLGSGGGATETASTTPADPTAPDSMDGSAEISPVVLADVPGLRDYKKRLDGTNGRNPFIQQTVDQPSDKSSGTGNGGGGTGSGTDTSSSAATSTDTSASTGTSTTPSTTPSPDSSTGGTSPDTGTTKPPKNKLVKFTIDVRVGRAGKTKVMKDVEPLTLLPGEKRPVLQYVNSNLDASRAGFVVSPLVTETEGDGKCDPGRNDCQFLFLEEGQTQKLVYGDKQETYRIELLGINKVLVPFDSQKSADVSTTP